MLILFVLSFTVQLDGRKSKEQLYNFVYGDILNIQNKGATKVQACSLFDTLRSIDVHFYV